MTDYPASLRPPQQPLFVKKQRWHQPPPPDIVTLLSIVDLQLRGTWPVSQRAKARSGEQTAGWKQELNPGSSDEPSRYELDLPGHPGARPWAMNLPALHSPPSASDLVPERVGAFDRSRSVGTLVALDA
eukprot:1173308-Prymnesium_polylepis.1